MLVGLSCMKICGQDDQRSLPSPVLLKGQRRGGGGGRSSNPAWPVDESVVYPPSEHIKMVEGD